jgi:dephospho-CoA kinase
MLKLRRVAVTGGIASGKSAVTSFFQKFGAYVVSADQIVHQHLSSNTALIHQVITLLGNDILENGCIDRKKMADRVFENPELLHKLEAVIHPMVAHEIEKAWFDAQQSKKYALFVAEVPLLFEARQDSWYDDIIAVICSPNAAAKRFNLGREAYAKRAALQFTQGQKAKNAKFIIENTGSLEELEAKVALLYTLLSQGESLDI